MKKSAKNTQSAKATKTVEVTPVEVHMVETTPTETTTPKAKGRPSNPNSTRQMKLAAQAEKRAAGILRKGRPVAETSARQIRIKMLEEKRAAGLLRKGRPVNPGSNRQQKLIAKAAAPQLNLEEQQ